MNEHRARIKSLIKKSLLQLKHGEIDFWGLLGNINGNINALDNLDKEVKYAFINLAGEMETIHYTVDSDRN